MLLKPWRHDGPRPLAGGRVPVLCLGFFLVSSARWWGGGYISRSEYDPLRPILTLVVRLVPAEGAWSCLFHGFPRTQSVLVSVGMVSGLAILIYGYHVWRWLLLWCTGPLWSQYDDFPFVYYNKLLRQALSSSSDGATRTVARLQHMLVFVVVAR
jgi:hypothetical protein